jgi:hypothetical protein
LVDCPVSTRGLSSIGDESIGRGFVSIVKRLG